MAELYWGCREGESFRWLDSLAVQGVRARQLAGNRSLITIADPDESILRKTLSLLAREEIRSAALVTKPLPTNEVWLAIEWWGRLVVEEAELGRVHGLRDWLGPSERHEQRHLAIFKPRGSSGPEVDEEGLGPIEAREATANDVRQDPGRYYGELADPTIGGANVLFAAGMEAARERGLPETRVLVGSAETFGFSRHDDPNTVVAWRRQNVIDVDAVGFSLGSWEEVVGLMGRHIRESKLSEFMALTATWKNEGFGFGVAMVLKGLEDPPVVIPMGSVYQQPAIGARVQNLAVGRPANVTVGVGAIVPIILPAYCLNPTFSPPSGPVTPTVLVHRNPGGSQHDVWDGIRRRYRGRP